MLYKLIIIPKLYFSNYLVKVMCDARSLNNWSLHIILVQWIFIRFASSWTLCTSSCITLSAITDHGFSSGVHPMMNTRIGQVICFYHYIHWHKKFANYRVPPKCGQNIRKIAMIIQFFQIFGVGWMIKCAGINWINESNA